MSCRLISSLHFVCLASCTLSTTEAITRKKPRQLVGQIIQITPSPLGGIWKTATVAIAVVHNTVLLSIMRHFYLISVIAFALAFCFWLAEVDTVPSVLCIIGGVLFVVRYFHDYAKNPKPLKWRSKTSSSDSDYIAPTYWYIEDDCSSSDCGDCSAS